MQSKRGFTSIGVSPGVSRLQVFVTGTVNSLKGRFI